MLKIYIILLFNTFLNTHAPSIGRLNAVDQEFAVLEWKQIRRRNLCFVALAKLMRISVKVNGHQGLHLRILWKLKKSQDF